MISSWSRPPIGLLSPLYDRLSRRSTVRVAGAYAGGGTGFFISNANDVEELRGSATALSANWGWGKRIFGLQLSWASRADGRTVWSFAFCFPGTGPGAGF